MMRTLCLWTFTALLLTAQDKPAEPVVDPLENLQKEADKKGAEWDDLAKGLEAKISRLLPCDTRVRSAIEEVARASDQRLIALRAYMEASVIKAKEDSEATQRLAAALPGLAAQMTTERADAQQENDGIQGQMAALGANVAKHASLADAQTALASLADAARSRAIQSQEQVSRTNALSALLKELSASYESRQKALETEVAALATESTRWNEYYSARVARSVTECSITNVTVSPSPRPAGKKKK